MKPGARCPAARGRPPGRRAARCADSTCARDA